MKISTFFAQISLLAIAIVATVTLCEGVYSLIYGQSLLRIPLGVQTTYLAVQTDAERAAAASLTEGPLAISWDPLVGYLMKPNHTHKFITELATADEFGQRRRVEPPATKGAAKIVILGDSVAFGYGVKDDETYASSLETHLAATMRADSPRPVVMTVACAGWNTLNSTRYLRNHLARLDPDIVLHLPIDNDLQDAFIVNEVGQTGRTVNAVSGAYLPHLNRETYMNLY